MSLLQFNNILVQVVLKSYYISSTIQILHHVNSWLFPTFKEKLCVRKVFYRFWEYFSSAGFFEAASMKMFLYLFWKMGKIRSLHTMWGKVLWKRTIYSLLLIYFLNFYDLSLSFHGMPFIYNTIIYAPLP